MIWQPQAPNDDDGGDGDEDDRAKPQFSAPGFAFAAAPDKGGDGASPGAAAWRLRVDAQLGEVALQGVRRASARWQVHHHHRSGHHAGSYIFGALDPFWRHRLRAGLLDHGLARKQRRDIRRQGPGLHDAGLPPPRLAGSVRRF